VGPIFWRRPNSPSDRVQLYTVRGEFGAATCQEETLKKIGQIGSQAVLTFWGYGGRRKAERKLYQKYSAQDLRKLLDETRIKCCGSMVESPFQREYDGDTIDKPSSPRQ